MAQLEKKAIIVNFRHFEDIKKICKPNQKEEFEIMCNNCEEECTVIDESTNELSCTGCGKICYQGWQAYSKTACKDIRQKLGRESVGVSTCYQNCHFPVETT